MDPSGDRTAPVPRPRVRSSPATMPRQVDRPLGRPEPEDAVRVHAERHERHRRRAQQAVYTRAVAFAGSVMSFVLPIWLLVTVAKGDPNDVLALCCVIFGATFILSVVVLARRS